MEIITFLLGVLMGAYILAPILHSLGKSAPAQDSESPQSTGPFFHKKTKVQQKRKPIFNTEEKEWMLEEKQRGRGFVE